MNHGNVQTAVHFKTHFVRFERWHTLSRNWETTNVPILTYESEIIQKIYKNREKQNRGEMNGDCLCSER